MDSLNGAVWFTALDLNSGYWQVKMYEASDPLMAFTVGPLGFYECDHMPFRLVNAPATFQRLMETCLGDLQLYWCLLYFDDAIVFQKCQTKRSLGLVESSLQEAEGSRAKIETW